MVKDISDSLAITNAGLLFNKPFVSIALCLLTRISPRRTGLLQSRKPERLHSRQPIGALCWRREGIRAWQRRRLKNFAVHTGDQSMDSYDDRASARKKRKI